MHYLLNNYSRIKKYKYKPVTIIIIALMLIFSALIVYYTGGTQKSYLHLVYIPILISAYFYKTRGGILSGIAAGLLLGPYMPIDTHEMLMQTPFNWIYRMFFFILVGFLAGTLFRLIELQLNKINKIAYYNENIELPNKAKLKNILSEKIENDEEFQLILFSIKNYSDIYKLVGSKYFSAFIKKLVKHISEYEKINNPLFYINDSKYAMYIEKHEKNELRNMLTEFTRYLNSPVKFKGISIFTDVIMGVVTYPQDGSDCGELIEKAFLALNKVKNEKRNFWVYEREAVDVNYNNIELLGDVDNSIKESNFALYYQPKINLSTNEVDAYEALIRWDHPKEGFILPGQFIHKIEQSSLIEPLTDWVIEQSINDMKVYEEFAKSKNLHIAINISARNFQDPNFVDRLIEYLETGKLSPEKFGIEITETDLMIEMDKNIQKLSRLREKGIKIYLDDFGKGYSSLRYLKVLPIDYIKIDKFFINNIEKHSTNRDIVLSIIKLSHALDIKVVAEGVETKEALDFLESNNCDFAQGYYFTRPDKKEEILKWTQEYDKKR